MSRLLLTSLALFGTSLLPMPAQRGPIPGINTSSPYLIYYGNWTPAQVESARTDYKLVILHPVSNITAADIASIQRGADNLASTADDVPVLAYISVGEDDRTAAPVAGDGSGPRIDPRASDSEPLAGIDPLGMASPNGTGFASYYLDDTNPDGQPDTNSIFGGPFVNAGDPAWYQVIRNNQKNTDGASGLQEIMTTTVGNAYGCDGVFLDTLDTPAPNSFGATLFEWTAPGFQTLLQNISEDYPDKIILGNRGVFFYNPNLKQYEFTLRPYLNAILFESYYTDSSDANISSPFFDDNKFNWAPKLNAEANRADGFTIFGLGYDHPVTIPQSVKDQDFIESMQTQGWPLYRTNGALNAAFNTQADSWLTLNPDLEPPLWDSTAATAADSDFGTEGNQPPAPRVGLQEVEGLDGAVTLRWDVARDQTGPVRYHVYFTDAAILDFNTATKLSDVSTSIPSSYLTGTGAGKYAYETTVTGLTNGTTYQFAVRAEDNATSSNEDSNTVTLTATPTPPVSGHFANIVIDGDFADWEGIAAKLSLPSSGKMIDFKDVFIANDKDFLFGRFTLHSAATPFADFNSHVFIDADGMLATGFTPTAASFGSEAFVESGSGFDQRNGAFNEGTVSDLGWAISPTTSGQDFEFRISRTALYADNSPVFGSLTGELRLLLQDNRGDSLAGNSGVEFSFAEMAAPYEVWRSETFTAAQLADPAVSGNLADPDLDGAGNFLEYALGMNPLLPDAEKLPRGILTSDQGQSYPGLQYQRTIDSGLTYIVQFSTDLLDWDDDTENFTAVSLIDLEDGTERVEIRLNSTLAENLRAFLRLKILE